MESGVTWSGAFQVIYEIMIILTALITLLVILGLVMWSATKIYNLFIRNGWI